MAFNSNPGRSEYTAIASQTVFPFVFKIFLDGDIKVYQTPSGQTADDTADILVITTDYTVTINGDSGGEITLVTGASVNDSLTIVRDLDINRLIEYQDNGDLLADTLNEDQNYQTYLIADKDAENDTHLRLPTSVQGVSVDLPSPISESYLRWNTAANALENDTTLPTNVQTAIDAASASAVSAGESSVSAGESAASAATALVSETNAELFEWEAEAERLTADSYATQVEDTFVDSYASDGDGTFTATPTTDYSSLHWAAKSAASASGDASDISTVTTSFDGILSGADTDVQKALDTIDDVAAPLVSPAFTGVPTVPTASIGTNTTQTASTAFVLANVTTPDTRLNTLAEEYTGQVAGTRILKQDGSNVLNQAIAGVTFNVSTGAILKSFGVASLVVTATGRTTVTLEQTMADANFMTLSDSSRLKPSDSNDSHCSSFPISTTQVRVVTLDSATTYINHLFVTLLVFGDIA